MFIIVLYQTWLQLHFTGVCMLLNWSSHNLLCSQQLYLAWMPLKCRTNMTFMAIMFLVMIGWLASDLKMISVYNYRSVLREGSHGWDAVFHHVFTLWYSHLSPSLFLWLSPSPSLSLSHTHTALAVVAYEGQHWFTVVLIGSLEWECWADWLSVLNQTLSLFFLFIKDLHMAWSQKER